MKFRTLISALVTAMAVGTASCTPTYCVSPRQLTPSFCADPPVVQDFDLAQYSGRWFQLHTSGSANRFSSDRCVTANYTLQADGTLDVLNCQLPSETERPQCQRAVGSRRVGGKPPQLQVQFAPFIPAGPYNVAALLGDAESGYEAAAIYSCVVMEDRPEPGVYIIARATERPEYVLEKLTEHMRCLGYVLDDTFFITKHGAECVYFDDDKGFEEVNEFEAVVE